MNRDTTLHIGWDVGGWEGSHDGLAALRWAGDGHLKLCAEPRCVRLSDELGNEFGVEDLLAACGVAQPRNRVVIGIDAPLGWPAEFVRLVKGSSQQTDPYLPKRRGEIGNRLAYRHTDRVVHCRFRKKPLSAAFDKLGNNATKAITLCHLLRRNSGAVIVPQEEDAGQPVVICEAYPALWKEGGARDGALLASAAEALARVHMPALGTDEADAVLCALTAACYDNQTRGLGRELPALWFPGDEPTGVDGEPDEAGIVRQEGWIYYPSIARS
jgi:predicted nuclease with RNAse H fold